VEAACAELGDGFPATERYPTKDALAANVGADPPDVWIAPSGELPVAKTGLPRFVRTVAEWKSRVEPFKWVFWRQLTAGEAGTVLTADELEQLVGVLASGVVVREDRTVDGAACLVAIGRVRGPEGLAVGWRWSYRYFDSFRSRRSEMRQLARESGRAWQGIHFVELSDDLKVHRRWIRNLYHFFETLVDTAPGFLLGISLPYVSVPATPFDQAWRALLGAAIRAGIADRLQWLWVDHLSEISETRAITSLASQWGLRADCSLSGDSSQRGDLSPYTMLPYFCQPFDIRTPMFGAGGGDSLLEVPRTSVADIELALPGGDEAQARPVAQSQALLGELFGREEHDLVRQLEVALDETLRADYLERLKSDASLVALWHTFHVYNWPPPPDARLRLLSVDAADLIKRRSKLQAVLGALRELGRGPRLLDAATFFQQASASATKGLFASDREVRQFQIDAHRYLADGGRPELTGDSKQLIEALPSALGATLELGFGYGLTARHIRERSTSYVGVDLEVGQAQALSAYTATGVVADVQALPFASARFDTVIADNVLEHAARPLAVFQEIGRVLRPTGLLFILIPLDARNPAYQIRTHLWKADERSICEVAALAGFHVLRMSVLNYSEAGVYGCFPASAGKTCLLVLSKTKRPDRWFGDPAGRRNGAPS
jgi:SAM-dependent methyltransferase